MIGISVCLDPGRIYRPGRSYVYLRETYVAAVETAGGVPVLLPMTSGLNALDRLDGVVISGGADIHPHHYGEGFHAPMELEEERRVDFDRRLIGGCLERGLPVLAVCYGAQLLNVHLGGTLLQTLSHDPVDHGAPGDERIHPVRLEPSSMLADAYPETDTITPPSAHRQAVDRLGRGLAATAHAPDGIVEAIELGTNVIGIQWHAESGEEGRELYRYFVQSLVARG